jgi:hypothetical protein
MHHKDASKILEDHASLSQHTSLCFPVNYTEYSGRYLPLLKLPADIRNRIYEYAVGDYDLCRKEAASDPLP